jgi:hypothetical protein
MGAIFISYRREDAEGQAGRLFDDLVSHFGNDSVFMDVAGLEPGRDFRRAIDQQVASCGVLLAIIGKEWLDAKNESGKRRLDDPSDFVRLETGSALKRDIPVIPVLVRGASMPRAEDLPEDLRDLAFRNGVELTHARWDSDLQVLVKALTPYVKTKPKPAVTDVPPEDPIPSVQTRILSPRFILPVVIGLLVLVVGGYLWYRNSSKDDVRAAGALEEQKKPTAEETKNKPTPEEPKKPTPEEPKNSPSPKVTPTREIPPIIVRPHIAPKLLSPNDGTVFGHFPRTVTLAWEGVRGATGYKLEIQFESGRWIPLGSIRDTNTTTYTFNFVGAQSGRWRVWVVDAEGREGPKSEWSVFTFTR